MQPVRGVQKQAEEGGPIVVQQLDEASLLNEAAELDELACACAPFLDPIAGIVQGLGAGDAVLHDLDAAKLRCCCLQVPE